MVFVSCQFNTLIVRPFAAEIPLYDEVLSDAGWLSHILMSFPRICPIRCQFSSDSMTIADSVRAA
jgi:hypothetical protein